MQLPFKHHPKRPRQFLQSQLTKVSGGLAPLRPSPDELLGELFQDVQLRRVYDDGMTFVDLVPSGALRSILRSYEREREQPGFDLHKFVQTYFKDYLDNPTGYKTNPNHTIEQHINELWTVLTHVEYKNRGSLIALPYPYVVPGGRFGAQWYWDSYFIMLGLAASERWDLVEGMIKNCAFMMRKVGYIPSGNRTYYLSRSQPPFFSHMVRLLAREKGNLTLVRYLPYMLSEYRFWMRGSKKVSDASPAYRRVVRLPDGTILNRYYDDKRTPRPESYKEDVETARLAPERLASKVFVDLRAAAESGWDFSSRWFANGRDLHTIHTTDILPVDLNCLLFELEQTIADTYRVLKQTYLAERYEKQAATRREAINRYCWNAERGFYFDYDFVREAQTPSVTAAGTTPLYSRVASAEQAARVASVVKTELLKPGGLVTTTAHTGEQWDAPNGWAPLQWMTIQGLRHYEQYALADEIKQRWIDTNVAVYKAEGKLVEKYNVADPANVAGGGEYSLQDGFGWTNGVLMALLHE